MAKRLTTVLFIAVAACQPQVPTETPPTPGVPVERVTVEWMCRHAAAQDIEACVEANTPTTTTLPFWKDPNNRP